MELKKSEFKVIWANRYLMIKGKNYDADFHSHHAIQISIALEDCISLETENEKFTGKIIVVNHQIKHALKMNQGSLLILLEPDSIEGQALKHWLGNEQVKTLDSTPELKPCLRGFDDLKKEMKSEIDHMFSSMVNHITEKNIVTLPIDERVRTCLEHIEANLHTNDFSLKHLAEVVYLSESRLQHLFKEQVGVPLTSYIQWFKVLKAVKYTLGGMSMTDAAQEGDFADSSHFSRAFRGMFGKSLSGYLKDSRMVQVIFI